MSDISTSGPAYRVVNPATGEVVETFEYATDGEIEAALAAVQTAYRTWRDVLIAKRAKTVTRIGELPISMSGPIGAGHASLFVGPLHPPMKTSFSVA